MDTPVKFMTDQRLRSRSAMFLSKIVSPLISAGTRRYLAMAYFDTQKEIMRRKMVNNL